MHGWRHTDGGCASHHTVVCIAWRKPPHKYANIFGGEKSKYAHMATHPSSAAVMNSLGRGGVGHARQNWLSLTIQPLDDWPGVEEWILLWKFYESARVTDLKQGCASLLKKKNCAEIFILKCFVQKYSYYGVLCTLYTFLEIVPPPLRARQGPKTTIKVDNTPKCLAHKSG